MFQETVVRQVCGIVALDDRSKSRASSAVDALRLSVPTTPTVAAMKIFTAPEDLSFQCTQQRRHDSRRVPGLSLMATLSLLVASCKATAPPRSCSQVTDVSGINDEVQRNPSGARICLTGRSQYDPIGLLQFRLSDTSTNSLSVVLSAHICVHAPWTSLETWYQTY
jgi:hypothetical protein